MHHYAPKGPVTSKMHAFNDYIAKVSDRDRVTSVIQFAAMALHAPAAAAGCPKLSADLQAIMNLSSQYRCITRFSQWCLVGPQLTPAGIRAIIKMSPTTLIGVLKTIATAFFTVFLFGEEVNLFAKYNILPKELAKKFNRIRFVFIFWSNIVRLTMNYLILKRSTYDPVCDAKNQKAIVEHKKKVLSVWDGVLMSMFAYGLLKGSLPAGPSNLPTAIKSGDIVEIIASCAPPVVPLSSTTHGILGLIASVPGFMMSVL